MVVNHNSNQEQFYVELQRFIDRPREGWILDLKHQVGDVSQLRSKMGGSPYPGSHSKWPRCPRCRIPLNFILQLHQRQFSQMWFPRGKNLFQIFRCPNGMCDWKKSRYADRYMLSEFCRITPGRHMPLLQPEDERVDLLDYPEDPIRGVFMLRAKKVVDYPSFYEGREFWWGRSWKRFQDRHSGNDWFYEGSHWALISNVTGIKIQGLPSWQQSGEPPKCKCGRWKRFIFQLASVYEPQATVSIGDAGNIYYFVCRRCGPKSLETCWDCG